MNETDENGRDPAQQHPHDGATVRPGEKTPGPLTRKAPVLIAAIAVLAATVVVIVAQGRSGRPMSVPPSSSRTTAARPHPQTSAVGEPTGATPSELAPPTPTPNNWAALSDFAAACEEGVNNWKAAQVDYPGTLDLVKDVPGVYVAAVDVNDVPLPPDKVISGTEPRTAPIGVQCVISARIVGDESMTVNPPEWAPRAFNPAGVLNWSWQVTARAAGSRGLQLQLQPAVATGGANPTVILGGAQLQTLTYVTRVVVSEPPQPERGFLETFSDHWAVFSAAIAAIGATVLSLVKWGGQLGSEFRRLWTAWGRKEPAETSPTTPEPAKKKGKNPKKKT
ncbi:hypothetical protein [Amycolatopsis sp. DG1A-15b]|uniref:hypothetical protein n=1 Tax=Amycolatopsis sp. DG1A-15b TaxID=3052846 RepID=UPI00255BF335|nr:hypothetical protein [Amycolatopsis sp. DG1A-15b]WIX86198.1 hypothetical protein QRY02_34075 [Amycolatopsis sp. DG1A-15b]